MGDGYRRARSGGNLPSLKPGEILGAGALADRVRLSALAGAAAFGCGAPPLSADADFPHRPPSPRRASPAPRATGRGVGRGDIGRVRWSVGRPPLPRRARRGAKRVMSDNTGGEPSTAPAFPDKSRRAVPPTPGERFIRLARGAGGFDANRHRQGRPPAP